MTTPSGPISLGDVQTEFGGSNQIAMSAEYYRGGPYVPAGQATSLVDGVAIPTTTATLIRLGMFRSVGFPPYAILTSGTSFTIPGSATSITVVCIGGGGSGGGGTLRTNNTGWMTGGGGGGGGGVASNTFTLTGGNRTISYTVGARGTVVGARDGLYSAYNPGVAGGATSVVYNSATVCSAAGGGGGGGSISATSGVNQFATAGAGGAATFGTSVWTGPTGGVSYFPKTNTSGASGYILQANGGGGYGAAGYDINTTTHAVTRNPTTPLGGVANDVGDVGNYDGGDGNIYQGLVHNSNTIAYVLSGTGTGYGGGGGGGGKDNEYWGNTGAGYNGSGAGSAGVVFLYW